MGRGKGPHTLLCPPLRPWQAEGPSQGRVGRNSLRDIDGVSGVQTLLSLELPGDTGCWRHEQGLEVLKVTG